MPASIEKLGLKAPLKISVGITRKCNLRCKHCLSSAGMPDENELTKDEWFNLLDQIAESGTKLLTFGGGEPLVRPDLFEIIEHAIEKGLLISIVTNGILLTKDNCKKLGELKLDTINVSFDGLEENHDYIRGKGNFERTIKGIKTLRKICPQINIAIRFTVNKRNMHECNAMLKLAEDLQVNVIRMTPVLLLGRAKENKELLLTQDDYINFLATGFAMKSKIRIQLPHQEDKKNLQDETFGCHCGKEAVWITQTGDFYPCIFFGDDFMSGNVRDKSYLELWDICKRQMTILCGNNACMTCKDFKKCRGGCRARALSELNDINAVDPLCPNRRNLK